MKRNNTGLLRTLVAMLALGLAPLASATEHLDGPPPDNAAADVTNLYLWVDGTRVVLVMTVNPGAGVSARFDPGVQYVFHVQSHKAMEPLADETDIVCTFDATQRVQCWLGKEDYVTGDSSAESGVISDKGNIKVFAGLRDDPAFFNYDGFVNAVGVADNSVGQVGFDAAGCPTPSQALSKQLIAALSTNPKSAPPGGPAKDFLLGKRNTLALGRPR